MTGEQRFSTGEPHKGTTRASTAIAEHLAAIFAESFQRHLGQVSREEIEGMEPAAAAKYVAASVLRRMAKDAAAAEALPSAAARRTRATADNLDRAWRMVCKGKGHHTVAEIFAATRVSVKTTKNMRAALEVITGSRAASEEVAKLTWGEAREAAAEVLGVSPSIKDIFVMRKAAEEQRSEAIRRSERRC